MIRTGFKQGTRVFLKDIERPELKPDDIRVRIDACGICGTDLHVMPGDDAVKPFGHEIAGTILEMGAHVTGLAVGQQVVLESSSACGRCANCRDARQELCLDIRSFWSSPSLGFAEEMVSPATCAVPYGDLSPEVACLQEPLGVAIDMVRLAEITPQSNVLLIGPGPIGLMALQLARHAGARRVFVSGRTRNRPARVALAKRFGADAFIDVDETPLEAYDFNCEIDRVLVTAPPRTLAIAVKVAAKGGIISYIGIEHGDGATCSFDANDFHFKKLQLRGSFAAPALFGPTALRYLREGVVDGDALISHRYSLGELVEAYEAARSDPTAVKVIVTYERERS
jgi:L-iditol 2-dehydrogenase